MQALQRKFFISILERSTLKKPKVVLPSLPLFASSMCLYVPEPNVFINLFPSYFIYNNRNRPLLLLFFFFPFSPRCFVGCIFVSSGSNISA